MDDSKLKVGDTVYVVSRWHRSRQGVTREVVKVGRKYVHLPHGRKIVRGTSRLESGDEVFESEEAYRAAVEEARERRELNAYITTHLCELPLLGLRRLASEIRMSILPNRGSKEKDI